ncbi:hypothetical protein GDO81_014912 [Engystomops pustulosus]|uniref:Uncharacterized protein n=1 Tax=Engystomops pustulosus TaxID=76066 RepID=A0AAV7ANJ4_ENGPU|nr:hypothetical protein GDO81_014912 [Engystomops pustulosus]
MLCSSGQLHTIAGICRVCILSILSPAARLAWSIPGEEYTTKTLGEKDKGRILSGKGF